MQRRDVISSALLVPWLAALGAPAASAAPAQATPDNAATAFDSTTVRRIARDLAAKPYQAPDQTLPGDLANIDYDVYRKLRFDPARALWHNTNSRFEVQFYHRGFLYHEKVEINEVVDGKSQPVRYSADLFDISAIPGLAGHDDLGFAGFRVHYPINKPDYKDEVCVFLGASYFRAVAKNQGYGLSARGLAIRTADPKGEEFPSFKTFWLHRPESGTDSLVISALLDSPSATGAFRFTIRPGADTIFDVEAAIYPRVDITEIGIAPLTSMHLFAPNDRRNFDDYRTAVHDSGGLLMWNGHGEQLWRPLSNRTDLQVSTFDDTSPRGFGLMQRHRDFAAYQDLEAHYEMRPSLWIEPIGDWGLGSVMLTEIPSQEEVNDNMVAFWRPHDKLAAKGEYIVTYRQHWCWDNPWPTQLGQLVATSCGAGSGGKTRLFVIDAMGEKLKSLPNDASLKAAVTADKGTISNVVVQRNPELGGWRMSFELTPADTKGTELRAQLMGDGGPATEAWIYRWTG
jgi:periplasmic glucans biosynthesis protein